VTRPDDTDANTGRCKCPACPTYNGCMREKDQRLYCGRGKTDCFPTAQSCICGECAVWADYGLDNYYYCMEGAAE
jgi:hypothetical protein